MFQQLFTVFLWSVVDVFASGIECPFFSLQQFESSVYSQNGEDGIILALMSIVGATNRKYVEFGVENGDQCNTRMLREYYNFTGLMMDGGFENEYVNLRREFLTIDNIVALFRKYHVPREFDLLSIDLDMFDFWILERILKDFSPRIIIAEVNPTLGHNIHSQSHQHFMTSFRELNSFPLVVNHPHTMEQEVWDGSRYSGANPLALQLLAREYGYEMVYCESCGVNCFFVHRSLLPEACPAVYPTPTIHYPCYGTGEEGMLGHKSDIHDRPPVLLSVDLIRQIKQNDIATLIADKFSSHLFHLSKRRADSVDRNEFSASRLTDEALRDCDCLNSKTCRSPDTSIQHGMIYFQTYFEIYHATTQPRHTDTDTKTMREMHNYDWTCFLLRHVKNSTICEELGHLHYQKSLSFVQVGLLHDARLAAVEGLKFRPHSKNLLHLLTYVNFSDFMTKTSAGVYSLTYVEVVLDDEVKVIGVGAGVCDNLRYRTQQHAALSSHHLTVYDKLWKAVLRHSFGGYVSADDGYTQGPRVLTPDDASLNSQEPYNGRDHFTSMFTHSCYRDTLFSNANNKVNQVCEKRSNRKSIIVISPLYAAVKSRDLSSIMMNVVRDDLSHSSINEDILTRLGCGGSSLRWTAMCRRALQSLASGFLPQVGRPSPGPLGGGGGDDDFWRESTQAMYDVALEGDEITTLLTMSDPLFSFMLPVWQGPVGIVQVVVSLPPPAHTVMCLAEQEGVSLETALAHYLFFFTSMLHAVNGFEKVSFVEFIRNDTRIGHSRGTVGNVRGSDSELSTEEIDVVSAALHGFDSFCPGDTSTSATYSRAVSVIPEWVQACVELLLDSKNVARCHALQS